MDSWTRPFLMRREVARMRRIKAVVIALTLALVLWYNAVFGGDH